MLLEQLISRAKLWVGQLRERYGERLNIELAREGTGAEGPFLRYNFETKHYLAELVIKPEEFQPFRHVSFMALSWNADMEDPTLAYCYYDGPESSADEIFANLDKGIAFIVDGWVNTE